MIFERIGENRFNGFERKIAREAFGNFYHGGEFLRIATDDDDTVLFLFGNIPEEVGEKRFFLFCPVGEVIRDDGEAGSGAWGVLRSEGASVFGKVHFLILRGLRFSGVLGGAHLNSKARLIGQWSEPKILSWISAETRFSSRRRLMKK